MTELGNPVSFFVVGAQKAGTTSLHHLLTGHPDVVLPKIKETKFFADDREYAKGFHHYHEMHFGHAHHGAVLGEVDPEYMLFPYVPRRLAEYSPDAKIIFVLRHPIDRAYSHFLMSTRRGFERMGFLEALRAEPSRLASNDDRYDRWLFRQVHFSYLERSRYSTLILRYLQHFSAEQCLILRFEELIDDIPGTYSKILEFLGLPWHAPTQQDAWHNRASSARFRWLSAALHHPGLAKILVKRVLGDNGRAAKMVRAVRDWNLVASEPPTLSVAERQFVSSLLEQEISDLEGLLNIDLAPWRS